MPLPRLYVSVEGPILIPSGKHDPVLGACIAEFARPFMRWAAEHTRPVWLTETYSPISVFYLNDKLGLKKDAVPYRGWDRLRTEMLSAAEDFYWVEDILLPAEVSWLAEHKLTHRVITVDPHVGVTPAALNQLQKLIQEQ